MSSRRLVVAWGPVVVWMGVIFFLSSQPKLPTFPGIVSDRVVERGGHLTEYAILAALCWRALRQTTPARYPAVWAFIITVLYAITDEWHQLFVPGRNGQPLDVLTDAAGTLVGLAAMQVWERNKTGAGGARRPAPGEEASAAGVRDPEIADGV